MAPLRRLPYPRRSRLAFPLVLAAAVLVVLLLALPFVKGAAVPSDGPKLYGKAAPDKTLFAIWIYGLDGAIEFIGDDSTLKSDTPHVLVYAPNAKTSEGKLELEFVWEKALRVVNKSVNEAGEVVEKETIVYEETLRRNFLVDATSVTLEDTELELPTHREPERVSVYYGESLIYRFTHHTSLALERTPRLVVQDVWYDDASLMFVALVLTIAGVAISRWIFRRAGNYVPSFGVIFWIGLSVTLFFGGTYYWLFRREWLIVEGWPLVGGVYLFLVVVFTLRIWRNRSNRWLFLWLYPNPEAKQPHVETGSVLVPPAGDHEPRREGSASTWMPWIDGSWKGAFWRFLGARTYLDVYDGRDWAYEVTKNTDTDGDDEAPAYARVYMLESMLVVHERPGFFWLSDEDEARLTPEWRTQRDARCTPVLPLWWGTLYFRKVAVNTLPVTPWAYDEVVMQVLADLHQFGEVAERYGELQVENAKLKAALEAESVNKARGLMNEALRALYAARLNKPVASVSPEFYERLRKLEPRTPRSMKEPTNKFRKDEPATIAAEPATAPTTPAAAAQPAGGATQ